MFSKRIHERLGELGALRELIPDPSWWPLSMTELMLDLNRRELCREAAMLKHTHQHPAERRLSKETLRELIGKARMRRLARELTLDPASQAPAETEDEGNWLEGLALPLLTRRAEDVLELQAQVWSVGTELQLRDLLARLTPQVQLRAQARVLNGHPKMLALAEEFNPESAQDLSWNLSIEPRLREVAATLIAAHLHGPVRAGCPACGWSFLVSDYGTGHAGNFSAAEYDTAPQAMYAPGPDGNLHEALREFKALWNWEDGFEWRHLECRRCHHATWSPGALWPAERGVPLAPQAHLSGWPARSPGA